MTKALLSQLLVIILLLPAAAWNLSKKNGRVNTSVVFIPVALVCSVILMLRFGLDLTILLIFICSLLFFLSNFWQLVRMSNGLRTDSTPFLRAAAVFKCVILAALSVCCVFFRPEPKPSDSFWSVPVAQEEYIFDENGVFYPREQKLFEKRPVVTILHSENSAENQKFPVFLYLPGVYSSTLDIEATITGLVAKGFMVVTADPGDLYARVIRPFERRMRKLLFPPFVKQEEALQKEKEREFESFLAVCRSLATAGKFENRLVYIAGDGSLKQMAENMQIREIDLYDGVFGIDTEEYPIADYRAEYGNMGIFHNLESFFLGIPRDVRWKQARRIAEAAEVFAAARVSGVAVPDVLRPGL